MRPPREPSFATKASFTPAGPPGGRTAWITPGVVGKSVSVEHGAAEQVVEPVTYAAPAVSTVIALPTSVPAPPRNVENTSAAPEGLSLVTKASRSPPRLTWAAPSVTGKSAE